MEHYPKLSLKGEFEIVDVGDDVIAVSVGDEGNAFSGVIVLENESTRFLFEKLQAGTSWPELVAACREEYPDSPVEEIEPKISAFLDQLHEKGLVFIDNQ